MRIIGRADSAGDSVVRVGRVAVIQLRRMDMARSVGTVKAVTAEGGLVRRGVVRRTTTITRPRFSFIVVTST